MQLTRTADSYSDFSELILTFEIQTNRLQVSSRVQLLMNTSKPASTVFKHFAIPSSNIDRCFKAACMLCGTVIYSTTIEYTCILITFSISNCNVFEIHFYPRAQASKVM